MNSLRTSRAGRRPTRPGRFAAVSYPSTTMKHTNPLTLPGLLQSIWRRLAILCLLLAAPGAWANVIQANKTYPPPNGSFRAAGPAYNFGSGGSAVQLKDVAFTFFDNFVLIGNPGGSVTFNAQFSHKLSLDGGATWSGEQAATAAFSVTLGPVSGNDHSFTLNSLTISGGDLPAGFQLRKLAVVGSPVATFTPNTPSAGLFTIDNTFYLSMELSQNSGATWTANSTSGSFGTPAFVLAPLSNEEVTSSPTLPPGDGQYYDANAYHSAFANGIVIRNPLHNGFLGQTCTETNTGPGTPPQTNTLCPPPILGQAQTEDFTSKMRFDIEMPGLVHVGPINATVQTEVYHSHDIGVLQIFRTRMRNLDPQPGTLPAGMNFRVNPDPSKPSLGVTTLRPGPTPDTTNISSSFALRLQMTTDGGATWQDSDQFTRMQLQILPVLTVSNEVVAGFNLLTLQLDNTNGLNALQTPEDGDTIYTWDVPAQDFSAVVSTYAAGFGWIPEISLAPGQAFFYVTMTPRTLTYTGTPHVPVLPLTLTPNVFHALGRQTNGVGTYENITGAAPGTGSQFNIWDPVLQDFVTNTFNGAAWSGGTPTAAVGRGVFIKPVPLQSYTLNINAGLNLIANQFDHGSNRINIVLHDAPAGSVLYKYDNSNQTYRVAIFDEFDLFWPDTPVSEIVTNWEEIDLFWAGGDSTRILWAEDDRHIWAEQTPEGWRPARISLQPGEGAFLRSPVSTTLTFYGNPHVPVLPVTLPPNQLLLLSRQTNAPGTPEDVLGTPATAGMTAYLFNGGYTTYTFDDLDLVWYPNTPVAGVGRAMWIGSGTPPTLPPDPLRILCVSNKMVFLSSSNWTFDTPGTAGGCSNVAVNVQGTVTNSYCPLVVTRTWQATDSCSNSVTCSQTVTVYNDVFHFQCPSNIVAYLNGSNTIPVYFAPSLSGGTLIGCNPPSGHPFPLGVTTVTCSAWDGCQSNVCSFAVTVLSNATCTTYSGLANCASGAATLGLLTNALRVSNIGTSGIDGVTIDLGQAMSFNLGLATQSPSVGATIQFSAKGSVGGVPNHTLGHVQVTRESSNLDGYLVSGDLSDTGASTVRLEVWSNNVRVALLPGQPAGALARASNWPVGSGKIGPTNGWPNGPIYGCYPVDFPDGTLIWVGDLSFIANQLQVLQEGGAGVDHLSGFSVSASGVADISIMRERVSHFPTNYAGLLQSPLGNASLATNAGRLTVSNLGSSGQDGVSIALGHAVNCSITLATQAPPVGASIQFAARGSVAGVTNHSLGFTRVIRQNTNPDGYEISGDLSDTSSTIRLELWNNGALQAAFPGRSSGLLARASAWPVGTGKIGPTNSDPTGPIYGCYPVWFDHTIDIWVSGVLYHADQVNVLQEGGPGVDYLSHFEITSGNLTGFEITSISTLQLQRRVSAGISGGQLVLRWNGGAVLQGSANLIHWTNLPAATSPFSPPLNAPKMFFRIQQ